MMTKQSTVLKASSTLDLVWHRDVLDFAHAQVTEENKTRAFHCSATPQARLVGFHILRFGNTKWQPLPAFSQCQSFGMHSIAKVPDF
jgi:hypothetical protein